jgi:hypothetical protein
MKEAKIIVNQIEGCQEGIMVVEDEGFYYVGMRFLVIGVQRFACSPSYRTIKGAERFARKRYAA